MSSALRPHGGLLDRELERLGFAPESVLDVSVSSNPYGPSPRVEAAVRTAAIRRYPDPECWRARLALAERCQVPLDQIALGHGASELIWSLARRWCTGKTALIVEPAFGEFRAAVEAVQGTVIEARAAEASGFRPDLAQVARLAREHRPGAIYLCNPSAPAGVLLSCSDLSELAREVEPCPVLLDEAYLSLSDAHAALSVPLPRNVLRIRSLTKELGLPGVRIGYLIAPSEEIAALVRMRPPWTVSAAAQAAVIAAEQEPEWLEATRQRVLEDRDQMMGRLRHLGFSFVPSSTLYVAVRVLLGGELARQVLLEQHRVLVRDCASFGLPGYIRVAARPPHELERLTSALSSLLDRRVERPRHEGV